MCYNGQLFLEFDSESVAPNKRLVRKFVDGWASLRPIHSASAFVRPWWPVLRAEDPDEVVEMQWGLIPRWAKEAPAEFLKKSPTYNAVSETAPGKPSFRDAVKQGRRCLVPMTGFYEWHHVGKQTFPHYIKHTAAPLFFVAGLYEGNTYTLLTTTANTLMAHIHNQKKRMPVILEPGREEEWLKPTLSDAEFQALCAPLPDGDLMAWPVSRRITSRTEDPNVPQVSDRVVYPELEQPQTLF